MSYYHQFQIEKHGHTIPEDNGHWNTDPNDEHDKRSEDVPIDKDEEDRLFFQEHEPNGY